MTEQFRPELFDDSV